MTFLWSQHQLRAGLKVTRISTDCDNQTFYEHLAFSPAGTMEMSSLEYKQSRLTNVHCHVRPMNWSLCMITFRGHGEVSQSFILLEVLAATIRFLFAGRINRFKRICTVRCTSAVENGQTHWAKWSFNVSTNSASTATLVDLWSI